MYILFSGIFQPHISLCLYSNFSYTIKGNNIKFPDRFIIRRRVPCSYNDPSGRHLMSTEGLILQKLQHSRGKCFRYTINLIDKQDSFFFSCAFHAFIYRCNYFAHGVFRYTYSSSTVISVYDLRKTYSTLPRVVSNRIRYQSHLTFCCNLLHNSCFTNSRRPHEKDGTLPYQWINILSPVVLFQIGSQSMDDLIFCFFYIHSYVLSQITHSKSDFKCG